MCRFLWVNYIQRTYINISEESYLNKHSHFQPSKLWYEKVHWEGHGIFALKRHMLPSENLGKTELRRGNIEREIVFIHVVPRFLYAQN